MPNELSDEALGARFFEVCWWWRQVTTALYRYWEDGDGRSQLCGVPPVSTDANACEAWAMRWARENKFPWDIMHGHEKETSAILYHVPGFQMGMAIATGTDWKEAFVRACVAAGEILNQAKGGA